MMKKILYCVLTLTLGLVLSGSGCGPDPDPVPNPYDDVGVTIAGTVWATRNVGQPGQFAATPESPGMFYKWNSKTGWSATDPLTSNPVGASWSGFITISTVWASAYDPCPEEWQVPTRDQLDALVASGSVWDNTRKGRNYGSGLFLPAAGYRGVTTGSRSNEGVSGHYWARDEQDDNNGRRLLFDDPLGGGTGLGYTLKGNGMSVRCVKK